MVKPFWKRAGGEGLVQAWLAPTSTGVLRPHTLAGFPTPSLSAPAALRHSLLLVLWELVAMAHTFFPIFPGEGKFLFQVLAAKPLP